VEAFFCLEFLILFVQVKRIKSPPGLRSLKKEKATTCGIASVNYFDIFFNFDKSFLECNNEMGGALSKSGNI
jgi:hypothetical protein